MPRISTALFTSEEIEQVSSARNEVRFRSPLSCFMATNGIRPAELSALIGPKGNGKSSLAKTIGFDCARSERNVYFLLSEENASVYKSGFSVALNKLKDEYKKPIAKRMYFDSMMEWHTKEKNVKFLLSHIEKQINELEIDQLIFDNITTSFIGNLNISQQGEFIDDLRRMASEYDMSVIGLFHTVKGTDVYNKLLDGEDVRGNATSTNISSYIYLLTTFFNSDPVRVILNIDKARYHKNANKTFWELVYDHETDLYTESDRIDYARAKALMQQSKSQSNDAVKKYLERPELLINPKIKKRGIWQ